MLKSEFPTTSPVQLSGPNKAEIKGAHFVDFCIGPFLYIGNIFKMAKAVVNIPIFTQKVSQKKKLIIRIQKAETVGVPNISDL